MNKSSAGKMGFKKTTDKWFLGRSAYHKNWLSIHAQAVYADCAGRSGCVGGKFPPRIMHPSSLGITASWVMKIVACEHKFDDEIIELLSVQRMKKTLSKMESMVSDDELLCIQAALFGSLWGRVEF